MKTRRERLLVVLLAVLCIYAITLKESISEAITTLLFDEETIAADYSGFLSNIFGEEVTTSPSVTPIHTHTILNGPYKGWFADKGSHYLKCETCGAELMYKNPHYAADGVIYGRAGHTLENGTGKCQFCGYQIKEPEEFTYMISIDKTIGGSVSINCEKNRLGRIEIKDGEKVEIEAIPDTNYKFKEWEVPSFIKLSDKTKAKQTFIMPARDVNIQAVFEKKDTVTSTPTLPVITLSPTPTEPVITLPVVRPTPTSDQNPTLYKVNVTSNNSNYGTVSAVNRAKIGDKVVLRATLSNSKLYKFVRWESNDVDIINDTYATASFIMPSHDVSIRAIFEKNAIVVTPTPNLPVITLSPLPTEPVITLPVVTPTTTISAVTPTPIGTSTPIVTPAEEKYTLTIKQTDTMAIYINGNIGQSVKTKELKAGEKIHIKAVPSAGADFLNWAVVDGNAISYQGIENRYEKETYFTMPSKNVTLRVDVCSHKGVDTNSGNCITCGEHVCVPTSNYGSDKTHHWLKCKYEGCDRKISADIKEHQWDEKRMCTICGYQEIYEVSISKWFPFGTQDMYVAEMITTLSGPSYSNIEKYAVSGQEYILNTKSTVGEYVQFDGWYKNGEKLQPKDCLRFIHTGSAKVTLEAKWVCLHKETDNMGNCTKCNEHVSEPIDESYEIKIWKYYPFGTQDMYKTEIFTNNGLFSKKIESNFSFGEEYILVADSEANEHVKFDGWYMNGELLDNLRISSNPEFNGKGVEFSYTGSGDVRLIAKWSCLHKDQIVKHDEEYHWIECAKCDLLLKPKETHTLYEDRICTLEDCDYISPIYTVNIVFVLQPRFNEMPENNEIFETYKVKNGEKISFIAEKSKAGFSFKEWRTSDVELKLNADKTEMSFVMPWHDVTIYGVYQ